LIQSGASDGSQGRGERTGSRERGAAHRTAAESSGDGSGFAEFRRAIPLIWGDLSRGKREGRERSAGLYRRGLDGHYCEKLPGGVTPAVSRRERGSDCRGRGI
jgi:hypothetical protein